MPLKLEVGKRYVTRGGRVTAKLVKDNQLFNSAYPFTDGDVDSWTEYGTVFTSGEDIDDLVSEFEPKIQGIPDGYRVVRFGALQVGELFMGSSGDVLLCTIINELPFFALIVEKIVPQE